MDHVGKAFIVNENPPSLLKRHPLSWKKEWTGCVLIVLVLRLIYGVIGFWVVSSGGPIPLQETIYDVVKTYLERDFFSEHFLNPWFGWDTISYLKIAILGYARDATVAFMPLYPSLIRLFSYPAGGNYMLSALVVSTLCAIAALILMHELFRKYYPAEVAWRTVLLFASFPTFFFLLAGYSESIFLVLVLAFWILALRRQWIWAGLLAGMATLTRLQGVMLSAVMLWMMLASLIEKPGEKPVTQVRQILGLFTSTHRSRLRLIKASSWGALFIAPIFAAAYQAWLKLAGYGTIADALRTYWRLETVMPWTGFILFLQRIPNRHFNYMDWIDLVFLIIVLIAAVIGLRRLDPAFSLYVWLTIAVLFTRGTPPHLLASYSRYFLGLFPLFVLPASISNRPLRLTVIILFFSIQILLVTIFLWGSWVA